MWKITKLQSYIIILIIAVFLISIGIAAYIDLTMEWSDYIDPKVIDILESETKVEVTVVVNSREEMESILDYLTESDFTVTYVNSNGRWFHGYISKNGLIKLNNRDDITSIYFPPETKLT